jgi:putative mRNA 3-end processing factor
MLILTKKGLYCPAGNFYIDPSGAVDTAVVTHAHGDHARRGSKKYFCAFSGVGLLKARLGKKILAHGIPFGEEFWLGPVKVSFHPAGHILGSAQVRLEYRDEVWVASGDYKREPDPTCEPFENVPCDVFITEATFGTPSYVWEKKRNLALEIMEWWEDNQKKKVNSVLFAYSLGKTQRILGLLEPFAKKPIFCHSAARELNRCYVEQGIKLAPHRCLGEITEGTRLRAELIVAPQAFLRTDQAEILGSDFETAFASGWMATRAPGYDQSGLDRGFVMSDHADWNDLLLTVKECGARTVYVQHRGNGALVKKLRNLGLHAFPDSKLIPLNPDQLSFL